MKVVNDALLATFRRKPRCEWCDKPTPDGCDPHHLWARGMGGGGRLDVPANLISLCRFCHNEVHLGHVTRSDLLCIVARRERRLQDDIEREIRELRRMRKPWSA